MTIAVIVLFFVLIGLFVFKLAVTDINASVFTAQPSSELPVQMAKAVISDNTYTISEDSLNSYAAFLIEGLNNADTSDEKWQIKDLYLDLREPQPSRLYLRVEKNKQVLSLAFDCRIAIGGGVIAAQLDNASVGQLPLPRFILMRLIEKTQLSDSEYIYIDKDRDLIQARFPTHYGLTVPDWGEVVGVDITTLSVSDSGITVTTNPVIDDALSSAADTLRDKLGGIADGIMSYFDDGGE